MIRDKSKLRSKARRVRLSAGDLKRIEKVVRNLGSNRATGERKGRGNEEMITVRKSSLLQLRKTILLANKHNEMVISTIKSWLNIK